MALASLTLNLKTDTSGWASGLKQGVGLVDKFYSGISARVASAASPFTSIAGGLASIGKGAISAAGGMALLQVATAAVQTAYAASAGAVMEGIDRIDQLTDAAGRIGVTTEALSALRYAADLTGSSSEDLDAAMEKLNANLGDAAIKANPASAALKKLGLDAAELSNDTTDVAVREIIHAFEQVPNSADKASMAMDIFGKGGAKLINTLSAGNATIDELVDEANRLGVSVSQVDAAKIGAAKDAMDKAGFAVKGLGNSFAIELAPFIESAATEMTKFLGSTTQAGGGAEGAVAGIAAGMASIADFAWGAQKNTQTLILYMIKAASAAEGLVSFLPGYGADSKRDSDWAKTFEEDMARAFDTKPSEKLANYIEDVRSKSREAAKAAADTATANLGVGSAVQDVGSAVTELTDKLRLQAETFGMTSDEIEIYKLAMKGATDAQLEDARAQAEAAKLEAAGAKSREKLKEDAKGYWQDTRTVAEKYKIELDKIAEAQKAGYIDDDTAKRATAKAGKDAGMTETKFASAETVGSESAYSTIVAALSGRGDGMNEVAKSTSKTATNTQKSTDILGRLLARFTGMKEPELINI